jgi:hypothetical protein
MAAAFVFEALGLLGTVARVPRVPGRPPKIIDRRGRLAGPEAQLSAEAERTRQPGFVATLVEHEDRAVDPARDLLSPDGRPLKPEVEERDGRVRYHDALARCLPALDRLGQDGLRAAHLSCVPERPAQRRQEVQPLGIVRRKQGRGSV